VKRRSLSVSPAASRELVTILSVIAEKACERVAVRWRKLFGARMRALVRQPYLGAMDDDLGSGRRRLVVAPYLIVYELKPGDEVAILRIVHGARHLPTLFNDLP